MKKNGFHGRGLTSLIVVTSFLIMTITGIVLYFTPHGRVAYWVVWQFIGLTKTDWNNIHIISSIAFAIAGAFHIYFNWKAIMNYLSGKISGTLKYKKELAVTGVLSVLIVVGSISVSTSRIHG
jgi:ABC-type Fe3+-siderophore transport system permease subunit